MEIKNPIVIRVLLEIAQRKLRKEKPSEQQASSEKTDGHSSLRDDSAA